MNRMTTTTTTTTTQQQQIAEIDAKIASIIKWALNECKDAHLYYGRKREIVIETAEKLEAAGMPTHTISAEISNKLKEFINGGFAVSSLPDKYKMANHQHARRLEQPPQPQRQHHRPVAQRIKDDTKKIISQEPEKRQLIAIPNNNNGMLDLVNHTNEIIIGREMQNQEYVRQVMQIEGEMKEMIRRLSLLAPNGSLQKKSASSSHGWKRMHCLNCDKLLGGWYEVNDELPERVTLCDICIHKRKTDVCYLCKKSCEHTITVTEYDNDSGEPTQLDVEEEDEIIVPSEFYGDE